MRFNLQLTFGGLLILLTSVACSRGSVEATGQSAAGTSQKYQAVSKDLDDLSAYECANPHFFGPEKKRCEFRAKSCRGGTNSESLICKRKIDDLRFKVSPAELVEVDGYLQRDGNTMFLTSAPALESSSIRILGDSCLSPNGKDICTYKSGEKLTVVGAYYTVGGVDGEDLKRRILVLDVWDGNRGRAPPLH